MHIQPGRAALIALTRCRQQDNTGAPHLVLRTGLSSHDLFQDGPV
jgi:hypothetical protein